MRKIVEVHVVFLVPINVPENMEDILINHHIQSANFENDNNYKNTVVVSIEDDPNPGTYIAYDYTIRAAKNEY